MNFADKKKCHPCTHLIIAVCFTAVVFILSWPYQAIASLIGCLVAWLIAKPIPTRDPGQTFLRIWLTAGVFLILIHAVQFVEGIKLSFEGVLVAGKSFFRIGALMASCVWLVRTLENDDLYAFLIDLRVPVSVIYVIFQALFMIPRFKQRASDILIAQQARGFVLKGFRHRIQALLLIIAPLFATTLYELEESAASLYARGLLTSGKKTHLHYISFSFFDGMIVCVSILISTLLIVTVG